LNNRERLNDSDHRLSIVPHDTWAGEGPWRIIHRILGSIVLALGLINISLGVFLAVLPLPVWVIWYIYLGILIIIIFILEILACVRRGGASKRGSLKIPGKKIKRRNFLNNLYHIIQRE
jgi:hypothetical protein